MTETIVIDTGCGQVDVPLPRLKKRSCNLHVDCDEADVSAVIKGGYHAGHCRDDCCEDCFGS